MRLRTGQVNDRIAYFDNGLLGLEGVGATYVVRGDELAIVETGTSLCAPTIIEGLQALGHRPQAVRHILLTHIHLDHAGGAGALARSMPEARVYIHSLTLPHLSDPARLLRSAERALGELWPWHGTVVPLEPERLAPAEGLELSLGKGLTIRAIPTPGHSSDHLAYYETGGSALFVGDAAGIMLPDFHFLGPVTPPPTLDVEAQRATFQHLLELPIEHLLFSHWGPSQRRPAEVIRRLRDSFERFDALFQQSFEEGTIADDAIIRALLPAEPIPGEGERVIAGWMRMNIRGMHRYYTKRREQESA